MPVVQVREKMTGEGVRLSYSVVKDRRGCGFGKLLLQMYEWMRRDVSMIGKRGDIILLSNNRNSMKLYNWLKEQEGNVCFYNGKLTKEQIAFKNPSLVISYNYSYIIPTDSIRLVEGKIINLHVSYLPWNRGSDPNFWSFIEDTPKGVTIHQLSAELDKGDILLQKEMEFNEKVETFKSTYDALNSEIVKLLQENWQEIRYQRVQPFPQVGIGSYHKHQQFLEYMNGENLDWSETIYDFKRRKMAGQ